MGGKKQTRRAGVQSEVGSMKTYFLVNPGGAIHEAPRELAAERLREAGWRLATADEVAELKRRGGHQTADNPVCEPWNPEPDDQDNEPMPNEPTPPPSVARQEGG